MKKIMLIRSNFINKIIFFICLLFLFNITSAKPNLISKLYCSIFGNQDVNSEYKGQIDKALADLGVQNFENIPVKKMNAAGPTFALMKLASFTAFGIWLNEESFDNCTEEEKIFNLYHEASHYVQKHHQKLLASSSLYMLLISLGLIKLKDLCPNNTVVKYSILTSTSIVSLAAYLYALPHFIKKQEKQADLMAEKTLINKEKENVVDAHIQHLKEFKNSNNNIWWYSTLEQIKYLEDLRDKLSKE